MNKSFRKLLAMLLCLVLLAGIFPAALAEDGGEPEEENEGTIKIISEEDDRSSGEQDAMIAPVSSDPTAEGDTLASGSCGENLSWTLGTDGTLTVTGSGPMTDYEWNYDRNVITAPWAEYYWQIRKLVVQSGVTSIGNESFDTCYNLSEVQLPATLTRIGQYALQGCCFTEIALPSALTALDEGAFYSCSALQSIVLPSGITTISMNLFSGCSSLVSVTIPANVTGIGEYAFSGCAALSQVNYLGTMEQWKALTVETGNGELFSAGIRCSDGTLDYSDKCGEDATWSFDESSGTLTISGTGAVWDNSYPWSDLRGEICRVVVEEGITALSDASMTLGAFQDCYNLTQVSLPEGLITLGCRCFQNCDSLEEVALPASLRNINQGAFGDCDSLLRLPVPEESETFTFADGVLYSRDMTTLVVCPGGKSGEFTVPDSVTAFGLRPFWGCRRLTAVHIPDTVTDLGNNTFQYCVSLKEVNIPTGVTELPISCFYSCRALEKITIPANVTSHYGATFYDCPSLKEIIFLGSAPAIRQASIFDESVNATAYYPRGDSSWTTELRGSLGGNITWIPALNTSAFPDPLFRAWVEGNADVDWNGILTDAELDAVTQMDLGGMGIASLEGIQYFPQLQVLDCSNNALTELDLSGNPALTSVFCNDNALTSLHVSSCPDLERLACYHNALQTLELRFCPKLAEAAQGPARTGSFGSDVLFYGGSGTNYVLAVDRSLSFQNPDDSLPITEAFFPDPAFRSYVAENLDPDKNGLLSQDELVKVTSITCRGPGVDTPGEIRSLKGIEYFPKLSQLDCGYNQITELDLSHNRELENLFCYHNRLERLNVSGNALLQVLYCNSNAELTSLDVSNCLELEWLVAEHTSIGSIDVSKNAKLYDLNVFDCGLRELDVSHNPELTYLSCYMNQLASLDLSANPKLEQLLCDGNQLASLNLRSNSKLNWLRCGDNELTSLDLSQNPELIRIDCEFNELDRLDLKANPLVKELYCSGNRLTELDLSAVPELEVLHCYRNLIGILDVSPCPMLAEAAGTERVSLENYGSGVVGYGAYRPYVGSDYVTYRLMTDSSTKLAAGVLPGDLNGNGTVEGNDLIQMRSFLIGTLSSVNRIAADVNGDGKVNIMDLIRLRKFLAGADVSLG